MHRCAIRLAGCAPKINLQTILLIRCRPDALPLAAPPFLMAADLPDDAWGVCADSLLPHELCSLARVSNQLNRAITSCRAYRYLRPFTLTGHAGAVLSVAVAPGGTIVSGSADGWLKEWTVAGTQATCQDIVQQRKPRKIISVAALPDGRIVSGNQNGQLMLADKGADPPGRMFSDTHGRSFYGLAVRQDGSVVSVGQEDVNGHGQLKYWDVAAGRCSRTITLTTVPICVAFLPDGRVLMGSSMSRLYVYDFTTNQILHFRKGGLNGRQVHATGGINGVAGLPNERAVSASDDKTIKVWSLAGGILPPQHIRVRCIHTLRGHRSSVLCVAALPRDRIVSGSRDKTLRVWDITEGGGHCLQTLRGHTGWVNCVGVLSDGRVVSGSRDKTLKVWGFIKCAADEQPSGDEA